MDYVLNMVNGIDENYIIMLNGLRFKGRIGGRKNSLLEADSIIVIFHQVVSLLFCFFVDGGMSNYRFLYDVNQSFFLCRMWTLQMCTKPVICLKMSSNAGHQSVWLIILIWQYCLLVCYTTVTVNVCAYNCFQSIFNEKMMISTLLPLVINIMTNSNTVIAKSCYLFNIYLWLSISITSCQVLWNADTINYSYTRLLTVTYL